MTTVVFAAALLSACLHAVWNAWVKSRGDANAAVAALVIGAGFPNLLILVLSGPPAAPAWGWMAVTVALSIVALQLLASAYREGDFAVAYPLIRGLIPIVLALAAVPLFGEAPTLAGSLGVVCVSAGLAVIAWESARRSRTMTARGLGLAALAAAVTAASVLTDAKGARLGANPFGYAASIAILNALVMAATQAARGHSVPRMLVKHWPVTIFAAGLSAISYVLFIWAITEGPVALVAALRETSMLFALLIAALVLRERINRWRWGAVILMVGGIALIRA